MPFLDRTTELTSIIESRLSSAKSSNQQKKKQQQQKSNNNQLQAKFYERASTVSNELQTTADTLQQLTKLVKKKTPFDDNVVQIQSLTASVKEQLARHDYFLREMNELIQQQQQQQQQKGDQKTEHSNHIVTGLNSRLMYATQQFQNVLQTRTKQIKQQQERRNIFTSNSSRSQFNKPLYQQPQQQQLQQQPSHFDNNNEVTVHIGGPNQQQQQQQLAVQETVIQVQRNDQHLRMRSDEIKSIEKDMRQLSDMFVELGQMVKMQGELAIRIDDKVSEAVFHIEEGQSELAKYFKRVSSNRGLVLKMFLVMVVFIIFIGVFVV